MVTREQRQHHHVFNAELLAKAKVDLGNAIKDLRNNAVDPTTREYFENLLKTWPGD